MKHLEQKYLAEGRDSVTSPNMSTGDILKHTSSLKTYLNLSQVTYIIETER